MGYRINTEEIGYIYIDNPQGEHMSWIEVESVLNKLFKENKELKNKIKDYEDESKYILIKKTESDFEYTTCDECSHYNVDYEEIIAFGEYETLTREYCDMGHHIEMFNINCQDYLEK